MQVLIRECPSREIFVPGSSLPPIAERFWNTTRSNFFIDSRVVEKGKAGLNTVVKKTALQNEMK